MQCLSQAVEFDAQLLQKYNQALPRYTSYPPATELRPDFAPEQLQEAIAQGNAQQTPLSLYCHLPFCEQACYFCGCNTIITRRKAVIQPYLEDLIRHIKQVADLILPGYEGIVNGHRLVEQMHWGGGTPNYLSIEQVQYLWDAIHRRFLFSPDAEISIEINPCSVDRDYVFALKRIGFNRISFGIQDFDPQVQTAVNRIQPEAVLFDVMRWIREAGFLSVNVDLIYGLPFQTLETFRTTVEKTKALNPDRVAVFNFAYVPWMKPIQKKMPVEKMPSAAEKLAILQMTIAELTADGYVFIGMDHFAKPNDELAIAQRAGQLHRNFQGYTTKPESDLLGFGITSISMVQDVYLQNHKRLKDFTQALDQGELPLAKGVQLSHDDLIRRTVIMELMCEFQVTAADLVEKYNLELDLNFDEYFARELAALDALEADGLINRWRDGFAVTPIGRLLIRNVAAVFDTYLAQRNTEVFSRSI